MIKDRYTQAMAICFLGLAFTIYAIRSGNMAIAKVGGVAAIAGFVYFVTNMFASGRLVDNEYTGSIGYKAEDGCGFVPTAVDQLDGLALPGGNRYKLVNGADVKILADGTAKPAGPGSLVMQALLGGGSEPATIQSDNCWRFPE